MSPAAAGCGVITFEMKTVNLVIKLSKSKRRQMVAGICLEVRTSLPWQNFEHLNLSNFMSTYPKTSWNRFFPIDKIWMLYYLP